MHSPGAAPGLRSVWLKRQYDHHGKEITDRIKEG